MCIRDSGYVDWKKNCSTSRSSYCGWHNHSPSRRSFGKSLCAGADWTNTVPTSHSYSYDRLHRSFRSWSARKRKNSFCNRCWYRSLPAGFATPMYGCRNPVSYTHLDVYKRQTVCAAVNRSRHTRLRKNGHRVHPWRCAALPGLA